MEGFCENLLETWCRSLLRLQIRGTGDPRLDGAILCPACGRIHGRCGEAAYPFLKMASLRGGEPWLAAARMAFQWSERNLLQPDGSLFNDLDVDWKGTTVFYAIQLADCLIFHGDLLEEGERRHWKERLEEIAGFLYGFEELKENNVNYPIANALALFLCGKVLEKPEYAKKAGELAALAGERFTENGLLFGEGIPHEQRSRRGCLPVDLGYNMEETLPSLALYGRLSGDRQAEALAENGLAAHLEFMTDDGGINNSFGTRCYKWTYWGSRTSDGCLLGLLLYGAKRPEFVRAARTNGKLLAACTHEGLLFGGPDYEAAGQPPCVHHTFTHAKVLAEILDRDLQVLLEKEEPEAVKEPEDAKELAGEVSGGIRFYPEIASWSIRRPGWYGFVTAYDWESLRGGHVSGGTLSFLWSAGAGAVLCSGMGAYFREEPANMQVFRSAAGAHPGVREESLSLRIEARRGGVCYSSVYEDQAECVCREDRIFVKGHLKDADHREPEGGIPYGLEYIFEDNRIRIRAEWKEGRLICPVVSGCGELAERSPDGLIIRREGEEKARVTVSSKQPILLPRGTERIFSLVPGFSALRLELAPAEGGAELTLAF